MLTSIHLSRSWVKLALPSDDINYFQDIFSCKVKEYYSLAINLIESTAR